MLWVSIVMSPVPWKRTSTVACVYADIVIIHAKWHEYCVRHTVNSNDIVLLFHKLISACTEFMDLVSVIVATGLELQGKTFRFARNIWRVHRLINNAPSITPTARFWTLPNQARTRNLLMHTNKGMLSSMWSTLGLPVRSGRNLICFTDYFYPPGRKSLFTEVWPAPVSNKLSRDNMALNVIQSEMFTR